MDAERGVDQLCGDANPAVGLAHAAFEHVPHAELACHLANVDRFALVGKGRIAGDDKEPALTGQAGDDVLGQPVGEVFLFGIAAHVLKWQYRDRRLVGQRQVASLTARQLCSVRPDAGSATS